jgi:hypothetical protein
MRSLLVNYASTDLIADSLLQEARNWAKEQLFGKPENNVLYCEAVKDAIIANGHKCELLYRDRREVIKMLRATVVGEEVKRRDDDKEDALERDEVEGFMAAFMSKNEVALTQQLGMEDGPLQSKFLSGILFATSASLVQVPFLQDVVMADGAHMMFGKYTLFSAYAITANGTMVPLGFAILFGNEDTSNWVHFWKFVVKIHPTINHVTKTIITDQDKGALASIKTVLPQAGLFHCSFHRRQNIKKKFGAGMEGGTPLSCLWMYNRLVKCSTVSAIRYIKNESYPSMKPNHTAYLDSLLDEQQYPAYRCHKTNPDSPDVYMYGRTASSGVESMNRANEDIRKRTAVDILNAALVCLKKEGLRFNRSQKDANQHKRLSGTVLTPEGMNIVQDIFVKCEPSRYRYVLTQYPNITQFAIAKNEVDSREYIVKLPKEPGVHGSRFGSCTCGFDRKEGIPCDHMVAIVKSGRMGRFSMVELMPFWYTRAQWKLQFPNEFVYRTDFSWDKIRESTPVENMKYCPTWVAPGKKGRPKKDVRKMGIADHVQQAVAKRARKKKVAEMELHRGTVLQEVDEDNAAIAELEMANLDVDEDTKDGAQGAV